MKETILGGLGYLSVEHLSELDDILDFLSKQDQQVRNKLLISLRLNPAVEVKTHPHLKQALNSKFGILFEHFNEWFVAKKDQFEKTRNYLSNG